MTPLYLRNGALLVRNNALVADPSCCCDCAEYTVYIRSGFGSNGVPTYSDNQAWGAQNGPTLSGSIWIWSSLFVTNPAIDQYFPVYHLFTLPQDAVILDSYINAAADNVAALTVNNNIVGVSDFGAIDGARTALPIDVLQPGANVISGVVTNFGIEGEVEPTSNPAGIIYTLVINYRSCL